MKSVLYKTIFWILALSVTASYGLIGYTIFDNYFTAGGDKKSGVMMSSFLFGFPFAMSATVSCIMFIRKQWGFLKNFLICMLSLSCSIVASIFLFSEGSICIIFFIGISIIACIVGVVAGIAMAKIYTNNSNKLMSIIIFTPFMLGGVEQYFDSHNEIYTINRSLYIEAPASDIWQHINYPTDIKPSELEKGFAYKIGVPYPVEARTIDPKVGGRRKLVWQRGVKFEEEITEWQENKHIEWIYHFTDDSFPEGSLDNHVKIGGSYFDLQNTSYTLRPDKSGTYLDISVKYRLSTNYNWYSNLWANFLISDTADAILTFYKNRSEKT